MHSSRMRTTRSLPSDRDPPGQRPPGQRPPGQRPPCHVTSDACWDRDPPTMNRMTQRFKNITLPQTSFAGGKMLILVPNQMATHQYFDLNTTPE